VVDCTTDYSCGPCQRHVHRGRALFKGRYDNLPLELWMLLSYPILGVEPMSDRLIYCAPCWSAWNRYATAPPACRRRHRDATQSLSALDAVFRATRTSASGQLLGQHRQPPTSTRFRSSTTYARRLARRGRAVSLAPSRSTDYQQGALTR